MSFIRVRRPAENGPAETVEIEGEIRDLLRKGFATARVPLPGTTLLPRQPAEGDDQGVGQGNSLIQRVAGASVLEIEKLVAELQGLRDFLHSKADRVQREMTAYVHLTDAAMKSTKIIADSVSQWKQPAGGTSLSAAQQQTTPTETEGAETEGTCQDDVGNPGDHTHALQDSALDARRVAAVRHMEREQPGHATGANMLKDGALDLVF
jgi:hypothetical protein